MKFVEKLKLWIPYICILIGCILLTIAIQVIKYSLIVRIWEASHSIRFIILGLIGFVFAWFLICFIITLLINDTENADKREE